MADIITNPINIYDLLICISKAGDLINKELENHHQQVAYLAYKIAEQLGLPISDKKDLIIAGLLHDIGALSINERLELIENEPTTANNHAFRGASLLMDFSPLKNAADIIRYHHIPWNNGQGLAFNGGQIPMLSHILHIADRVAVLIDKNSNILGQVDKIKNIISSKSGSYFASKLVDAFMQISTREYIWLDLVNSSLLSVLPKNVFDTLELNLDELINLTKIFSRIIDFRSHFTANHSAGVANAAAKLAELAGFAQDECKMMLEAGNLHDLGKLAVRKEILEKPGKLTPEEFNEVKTHTYHTYRLLDSIRGFETINKWASYHHEKLNGTGYPFRLTAESIPLGSRIMAVADVFTAVSEDRPYRKGMRREQVIELLRSMADNRSLCANVVALLIDNYKLIDDARIQAQQQAEAEYGSFYNIEFIKAANIAYSNDMVSAV